MQFGRFPHLSGTCLMTTQESVDNMTNSSNVPLLQGTSLRMRGVQNPPLVEHETMVLTMKNYGEIIGKDDFLLKLWLYHVISLVNVHGYSQSQYH